MLGLGPPELIIIAIVILALFGYKKLPDAARAVGRSARDQGPAGGARAARPRGQGRGGIPARGHPAAGRRSGAAAGRRGAAAPDARPPAVRDPLR